MSWDGTRAADYDKLDWTTDDRLLSKVVGACCLECGINVLDYGCGTGIVSERLAKIGRVVAYDPSPEMLAIAKHRLAGIPNVHITSEMPSGTFDVIVLRNVLHHLAKILTKAWWLRDMLGENGKLVLCEGVAPPGCLSWYKQMFKAKEKRQSPSFDDLVGMIETLGMDVIQAELVPLARMSLNNWIANSHCDDPDAIWYAHANAPEYVKKAYDMKEFSGDIEMTWQFAIVVGRRP